MDKSTKELLAQAEKLCAQRNVRLTPQRLEVLRLMSLQQGAISAYDLLDLLRESEPQAKPPTVYRALDFLLEQGLIHRLASLNVFTVCRQPGRQHGGQFLICRDCGQVDELSNATVENLLRIEAETRDFEVLAQMVEILGRCPDCRQGATAHGG